MKEELKKEAVIALWNKTTKESSNKSDFQTTGSDESPFYILSVEEGISIIISAIQNPKGKEKEYNYNMSVIFGEFVEYARFDLDKSEYDSLADMFVKSHNDSIKTEVNDIVAKTEDKFIKIIKSCEV